MLVLSYLSSMMYGLFISKFFYLNNVFLANNKNLDSKNYIHKYLQTTRKLFDGKINFRVGLKHHFSGELMRWYGCWTGYLHKGCKKSNKRKSLTQSKKKSPAAMRKEIELK